MSTMVALMPLMDLDAPEAKGVSFRGTQTCKGPRAKVPAVYLVGGPSSTVPAPARIDSPVGRNYRASAPC